MTGTPASFEDLDSRSREIFHQLVQTYLASGEPVGSRTLSRHLETRLSPASIRNVMQDLEHLGVIAAPHVSAGRVPTVQGLRLFLDAFMQVGDVDPDQRRAIEGALNDSDDGIEGVLERATSALTGLSQLAGLVVAPKQDAPIEHVEITPLSDGRAMAILVMQGGAVENRLFELPAGMTPSAASTATNFLNAHMRGRTLAEARVQLASYIEVSRAEIDTATQALIERGIADWVPAGSGEGSLIVKGLSNLLKDANALEEIEGVRMLFDELERKRDLAQLLELAEGGEGVRVFIGAESKLFTHSGSALVISPYMDENRKIVGALGVIGPTRLNYARIMPIVDFTARMVGQFVSGKSSVPTGDKD